MTIDDFPEGSFLVVGIGASAGGLDALQRLLAQLPRDFTFALVFIQHLSKNHRNLLPELLSTRHPSLVIQQITDGLKIQPGRLYLAPPGSEVRLRSGFFRTTVHPEGLLHLPIDEFLTSLAEDAGGRSLAVILSGAGTDGARGCRDVRTAGGTVIVQDPRTAEFDGMPLAAIGSGQADAVLAPEDIASELGKLQDYARTITSRDEPFTAKECDAVYRILLDKTGSRFNHYKKSVVGRRITRRMHLNGCSTLKAYLDLVATSDAEAAHLASDLLIGVTSFFRDRVAWKALSLEAVRRIVAESTDLPIRVWTPGTATGEEAYSIAMMLLRELALAGKKRDLHVFATDVNDRALDRAREGKYPTSVTADIAPEYVQAYFTSADDGNALVVGKEVRECVVFARQDLLTDPPFSKLDLIICRNFLIYLEPEAQEKCIDLFHYALKTGGFLFLGNAETVGKKSALFKSIGHKQCRIYRKLGTKRSVRLPVAVPYAAERRTAASTQAPSGEPGRPVLDVIQEKLLEEYAPAAVGIDQNYEIVYHNGPTNRYLLQPRGAPTRNLFALVPDTLRSRIRGALYRAGQAQKPVVIRATMAGDDHHRRPVTLRVMKAAENLFIVVFHEKPAAQKGEPAAQIDGAVIEETAIHQLESELIATRADLQNHIEQLKSTNEELQSANEELQAANEELETSREELQSLNEELITVNAQLQGKIEEQDATNNDLYNFQASTNIPMVFLDTELRVKRFTPAMLKLIQLLPADVGRPIADLSQDNLGQDLIADARSVLDGLQPRKRELELSNVWYVRTTLPYRTADNRIEGVVVTYADVTDLKRAQEDAGRLAALVASADDAVISKDLNGVIQSWNAGAEHIFGYTAAEVMGRNIAFLVPPGHDDEVPGIIQRILLGEHIEHFESLRMRKDGSVVPVSLTYSPIKDANGRIIGISKIAHDVTERRQTEQALEARLRLAEAATRDDLTANGILRFTLDEIEKLTGSKIGFYHFLEADQEIISLQAWSTNTVTNMCTAGELQSHYPVAQAGVWADCVRERRPIIHNDYPALPHRKGMPEGHAAVIREMVVPLFRGGLIVAIIGMGNKETDYTAADTEIVKLLGDFSWEIVERKRAEDALRKSVVQYRGLIETANEGIIYADTNGRMDIVNRKMADLLGYPLEEVIGKVSLDFMPENERARVLANRARLAEHEQTQSEFCFLRKDGTLLWTIGCTTPIFNEQGEHVGNLAMHTDITERKKAEAEVLVLARQRQLALDAAQLGWWQYNPVTRVAEWDDGYKRIFGVSDYTRPNDEILAQIIHPDDLPALWAKVEAALDPASPEMFATEYRIRRPDGAVRWIEAHGIATFAGEGEKRQAVNLVGTVADITERKKVEQEILDLTRAMTARNEELESANQEMESFIYSVSHDLRAPLRSLSGFSQMLAEDCADRIDDTGRDYLARIQNNADKMTRLISDLLHLSKLSRQEIDRIDCDLSALAETVVQGLRESAPGRDVAIKIEPGLRASVDPNLMRVVLTNLLGNAWKFTAMTAQSRIEFSRTERNRETIFVVKDNGAGFDPAFAAKIFWPFHRLHSDKEFEGTGIGLAIVERVIRRHGGRVWAEAAVGKGATFYFTVSSGDGGAHADHDTDH